MDSVGKALLPTHGTKHCERSGIFKQNKNWKTALQLDRSVHQTAQRFHTMGTLPAI